MNRKLKIFLWVVVLTVACSVVAKWISDCVTFRDLKTYDRSHPLNVKQISSSNRTNYIREEFSFEGCPGEEVPVLTLVPAGNTNRYPAIILLYGIGMKMNFADRDDVANAVTKAGFALFVPEQYGRGRRRKESVNRLQEVMALRHRIVLTIKETRRLVDVISERPDIDPARIYFWGASFGAMTGCSVMAYDQRLPAGIFTLAAGDFQKMAAESPYRSKLDEKYSWMKVVAPAVASFLRPFDPIYHIDRIAPRPLLFQNANNDELIARSAVDALYGTAGEPKQILWYDSPHDHLERAVIEKVVGDALAWLQIQDDKIVSRSGKSE
ncbi:MAG: hypothetical protein A2283_13330 [Lentisphaerae bacterium RIFOXYA12_FULL_48_11]|nr:MAG: hypothetical protein A2283_13330 [Lentisphaerae bacterium RIFOXYA12_FULL_48_11]